MEETNIQQPLMNDEVIKDKKEDHHLKDKNLEKKVSEAIARDGDDVVFQKKQESICTQIFWGILSFFNVLKMITMFGLVAYFWIWTSDNRMIDMDVLEQLCKHGELNITFHENRMFGPTEGVTAKEDLSKIKRLQIREADSVVFNNFKEGSVGHMPDMKWKPDCKKQPNGLENPECLIVSHDIAGATLKQMRAELGDKTFLLIIIFTIAWSNWHLDMDKQAEEEDKILKESNETTPDEADNSDDFKTPTGPENEGGDSEDEAAAKLIVKKEYPKTKKNIHIHPARIYITATIGLVFANVMSITFQNNIFANETRLTVSILIVVFLLFYMYNICRSHIEWETEVEEIDQKHKDAIMKMRKQDIIEKYQDAEKVKKQRKDNQRRSTIDNHIHEKWNQEVLLNEEEYQVEMNDLLKNRKEEAAHKELVNVKAMSSWHKATEGAAELAEEIEKEQNESQRGKDDNSDDKVSETFVETVVKEQLDEANKENDGSHISEFKRKLLQFLVDFRTELVFLLFITTQEIQDTSYQTQIIMRVQYSGFSNMMGCVFSHIIINLAIISIAYLYTGLCMTTKDSNIFGITTFYFITGYEFLFHILRWGAAYLNLLHYKGDKLD